MSERPLTEKARRFAECYAGDGVSAAREAGYGGDPNVLKVTASRLLKDERVKAIIEEREAAAMEAVNAKPQRVNVKAAVAEAVSLGVDPIKILEELATKPTVHDSSRLGAAKELRKWQRETHQTTADPHADLRAKVTQIVLDRRAREREERET